MNSRFDPQTNLVPECGPCGILQQSHDIRSLLGQSIRHLNSTILYDNAFPTSIIRNRLAKTAITSELKEFQPESLARLIEQRVQLDPRYFKLLVSMVRLESQQILSESH